MTREPPPPAIRVPAPPADRDRARLWAARAGLAVTGIATAAPLVGHPLGSAASNIAVMAAGFALVVWGGRHPGALNRRIVLIMSGALLTLAVIAAPIESGDVWSYAAYGRMVSHYHANPFTHVPADFKGDPLAARVAPTWRHTPSVYGPLWVALSVPGTALAGTSLLVNRLYFELLAALSVALAMWIVDHETSGNPLAMALLGVNPFVVICVVNGAHNDATVGLAVLAAIVLARRARWRWCAAALAAAIAMKAAVGLAALALVIWVWRWKTFRTALALIAWTVGVTGSIYLVGGGASALSPLDRASEQISHSSMWHLAQVLSPAHATAWISPAGMVVTVGLVALLALRYRSKPDAAVVVGLAVLIYGIAAPYVYPWYLAWGLPVLALGYRSRTTKALLGLSALLALGQFPDPHAPGAVLGFAAHAPKLQAAYIHWWLPVIECGLFVFVLGWAAMPTRVIQRRHPGTVSETIG